MSGLGGLNKSPNGVVLGMVQLQLPVVETPQDLLVIAAGGRAGVQSAFIPGWGSKRGSQSVTREIRRP